MGNELAGKVAVVTGGAAGLGAGVVERFLAEGAVVAFGDIDTDRGRALADRHGDRALFLETDVAQTQQVTRLVDTAVERFGALHVMVNNAGVSGKMQRSLLDDDLCDFERVMAINVKAVMAGTRDAARHMTETGGSIINLTSIGGIQAGGGVVADSNGPYEYNESVNKAKAVLAAVAAARTLAVAGGPPDGDG